MGLPVGPVKRLGNTGFETMKASCPRPRRAYLLISDVRLTAVPLFGMGDLMISRVRGGNSPVGGNDQDWPAFRARI